MRKLIPIIICLCALLGYNADAQTWLIPKPTTTYPNPQSIYYNTTNLFINSFYLGGSNGFSGYWIWNGIRLNGPQDLAVAVSNSVAPSNFVYKVDLDPVVSNLHLADLSLTNNLNQERTDRIAADLSISNILALVPTNAIIVYTNSPTNYMVWTNRDKQWYFIVCVTNGGSGGFGGTNIINITNIFNTTNMFDTTINNTNYNYVSNSFSYVAGDTIISNRINITNNFLPVNNVIAGTTYVTNYFSNTIYAGNTTVSNFNYSTNIVNVTNHITNIVGSVVVTNFITNTFNITNNSITVVTNIVTNNTTVNPSYNLSFSPSNINVDYNTNFIYITNIVENTNTVVVTNIFNPTNINAVSNFNYYTNFTLVTNINNITNEFSVTNNITNNVVVGDTTVNLTNTFNTTVSNDINIAGVVVTNVITNIIYITNLTQFITEGITNFVSVGGGMTGVVVDSVLYLDTSMFPTSGIGSNLISISISDQKVYSGIIQPADTNKQYLIAWDGTNVVWWDHGLNPSGTTITTVLSRLVITNFFQGATTNVDGIVVGVYDNSMLSNDVYTVEYTLSNKDQFITEQVYGFDTFIVSPTSGFHGKFTNSIVGTKLTKGCSLFIGGQYYPIVNIRDVGTNDSDVIIQTYLPSNTTQTVTAVYGTIYDVNYAQLSKATDPLTTNELIRFNNGCWDANFWCCTKDGVIQYYIQGKNVYKSIDGGSTFKLINRIDGVFIGSMDNTRITTLDGTNVWVWKWDNTPTTLTTVYVSTNGMQSYSLAPFPPDQYHDIFVADTNLMYCADRNDSIIRKSTNNGVTWTTNAVVGTGRNYSDIACSSNGQVIIVSAYNSSYYRQVYVSTNYGVNWITNTMGAGNDYSHNVDISPNGQYIIWENTIQYPHSIIDEIAIYEVPSTPIYVYSDPDSTESAGLKLVNGTNIYSANRNRLIKNSVNVTDKYIENSSTLYGAPNNINIPYRDRIYADALSAGYSAGVSHFSVDAIYPNIWYIMGQRGGVNAISLWISVDYGKNWYRTKVESLSAGNIYQSPCSVNEVAFWPYYIDVNPNIPSDTKHSILRTTDLGQNWQFIPGQRLPYIYLNAATTNIIYSTVTRGGTATWELCKSTNGGLRFYLMGGIGTRQRLCNVSAASFNNKTNIIFSSYGNYNFPIINEDESNNDTFTIMDLPWDNTGRNHIIQRTGDSGWMYTAYNKNIYWYDNGLSFSKNYRSIASGSSLPYIVSQPEQYIEIYFDSTKTNFYMGIYAVTNLFISTNEFASYSALTGSPKCRWHGISTHDGNIIWAGGSTNATASIMDAHAFLSIDGGVTWSNKTLPVLTGNSDSYVFTWSIDGTNAYIYYNSRFYKTTDMGTTFTPLYGGVQFTITDMSGDRNNRKVGGPIWLVNNITTRGDHGIWVTRDEFNTITPYGNPQNGFPDPTIVLNISDVYGPVVSSPSNPNLVFVGKRDGFVYQSTDGGTNWLKTDLSTDGLSRDWTFDIDGNTIYAVRVSPYLNNVDMFLTNNAEIYISRGNETPNPINPNARVFTRLNINGDTVTNASQAVKGVEAFDGNLYLDNGFSLHTYREDGFTAIPSNNFTILMINGVDARNWATIGGISISDFSQPTLSSSVSYLFSFDNGNKYMKYEGTNWVSVVTNNSGTYWYRVAENSYASSPTGLIETISIANNFTLNRFTSIQVSAVKETDYLKPNGFTPQTTNILVSTTFIPPVTNNVDVTLSPIIYNTKIGSTYNTDYFTKRDTNYNITVVGTESMTNTVRKIGGNVSDAIIYYMKGL